MPTDPNSPNTLRPPAASDEALVHVQKVVARRILQALAVLVVALIVALSVNRWIATRTLEAARARSEELGLRFDPALLDIGRSAEAQAALEAANLVCSEISDASMTRMRAEKFLADTFEALNERFDAEEAAIRADALMAAAERLVATGVRDTPERDSLAELRPDPSDAATRLPRADVVRYQVVNYLCGAAVIAFDEGRADDGWTRTLLAARLAMTSRDTVIIGVGFLGLHIAALQRAVDAADAVAPDHAKRTALRQILGELDLRTEARSALRREAALLFYVSDAKLGFTHAAWLRLGSFDVRDRARLHDAWAELIDLTSGVQDPAAALAALDARIQALPIVYPLVKLPIPRAVAFWKQIGVYEAKLNAMLAE